ncbi:uncharacterized protein LOC131168622 [Malania oleifera]|uniref:uncharacterized protein LOC131168622 n=1 Tax=Malania oleifera TaxID=397392 RepID=UPI0025AE6E05|nr:uncharacterized protein LOC131168622 [Malania oleifera]
MRKQNTASTPHSFNAQNKPKQSNRRGDAKFPPFPIFTHQKQAANPITHAPEPGRKMKLSAKTISSPGRPEKFPPPLMRFLRSNVGSRSRGRSRSSAMFMRKKNNAANAVETQEPSSPKVTCIGQVRVRRSKQAGRTSRPAPSGAPARRRRCRWIQNTLFFRDSSRKLKPRSFRAGWRKWVVFFKGCCRRRRADSSKTISKASNREHSVEEHDPREEEEDEEEQGSVEEKEDEEASRVCGSYPCIPPRNALLLTRCRSAPYRSSSLASRFWGSPLVTEETGEEHRTEDENGATHIENIEPASKLEPTCRDSAADSRKDPETLKNLRFLKEFDGVIERRSANFFKTEELGRGEGSPVRPPILTRCKSAPAIRFEKVAYW